MLKCPSCSAQTPESNRFCGTCGSPIETSPDFSIAATMAMPAAPPPHTPKQTSATRVSHPSVISSGSFDEGRFLPGTLVAERYRIIGLLGRGGMGEVYRATDLILGQQVALKFLVDEIASDPETLERFHNEVRIARQVSHPNVCRVYDIGVVDGSSYISMEYVDGEDLGSLLRRIGRLSNDKAVELARKICAGLAAAHDKGVLHRDLKPANIMVDGRGQALLTDFGLAGIANQIKGAEIRHGTPAYMAPEQLAGKEVTVRSDIYSLGLVLHEMITGKRAYDAPTMAELVKMRQDTTPRSLTTLVRDLDPAIERIVNRCLDPDPQNRPASALAVAAALPGGDPLAAALAAGETPSPELVAAATEHDALQPMVALACLVAILAGIAVLPFLISRAIWLTKTPFENPPDVLAQKSREFIKAFGYTDKPGDTAYGFHYAKSYLTDLTRKGKSISTLAHLGNGQPAPIRFWYRTSPRIMNGFTFGSDGDVEPDDPPLDVSGMVEIELDPQGRLASFDAVPPEVDKSPPPTGSLDGKPLFAAAGLDLARFKAVEPEWTPLAVVDQRAAWTGTYPDDPNPLRVEAASWRGKLVYFALISPWTQPSRSEVSMSTQGEKIGQVVILTMLIGVVFGACLLARHNIRSGRGDWRSAFRLSGFLFCLTFVSWIFGTHHVPANAELVSVLMALCTCFLTSALIWVQYVAIEPYVRRHWPRTIISSTRILTGKFRDPVVGGHILVGLLYGVGLALSIQLLDFLKARSTGIPDQLVQLSTLLGVSRVASLLLGALPGSMLNTLGVFFLIFIFRVIFRREWLAAGVFVLILTVVSSVVSPFNLYISVPVRLLQYSLMIFVLLRFGLLPFVVGSFVNNILLLFPITTDFSAWYAGSSIFALAFLGLLAAYMFRVALAGRPLFKAEILDS